MLATYVTDDDGNPALCRYCRKPIRSGGMVPHPNNPGEGDADWPDFTDYLAHYACREAVLREIKER